MEPRTNGAPPRSRDWIVPLIVLLVGLGVLVALVIGGLSLLRTSPGPSASPSGHASAAITASPSPPDETEAVATPTATGSGDETSVFDLEVGDCFSADSDVLTTVTVVDCEQSHEYEAFALLDHEAADGDPYPGDGPLLEYANTGCEPPFEAYVGRDYQTSIWYITSLYPSEETWAEGDREVVCTLNQQDANREPIAVTGTAQGSGD